MSLKNSDINKIFVNTKTLKTEVVSLNREGWLTAVADRLSPLFPCGLKGKPFKVTCGWPSVGGLGARSRRVGECHALETSKAGVHEIFISPLLDDPLEVTGTLMHELAHVGAGLKAAHGKDFVALCTLVGLTAGKPKSVMPGNLLNDQLKILIKDVGVYPHKALVPTMKPKAKKGGTVSLICEDEECGCKITMAAKWIDEIPSLPTCGCGSPFTRS